MNDVTLQGAASSQRPPRISHSLLHLQLCQLSLKSMMQPCRELPIANGSLTSGTASSIYSFANPHSNMCCDLCREPPAANGQLTSGTASSIYGSANSQEVLSDSPLTPTSMRGRKRADSRTAALIRRGLGKANVAGKITPPWVNPSRHAELPQVASEPRALPHEQRSGIALRAARSRAISAEQNARELQRQR